MNRTLLRFIDKSLGKLVVRAVALYDRAGRLFRRSGRTGAEGVPANILAVKLVGLGDTVLMLTPLARLRAAFPEARITVLATPLSIGVLPVQPAVDEVIVYDVFGGDKGVPGIIRISRLLKSRRFDCVIDFEQHFQLTSLLAYLTGAPRRIGFYYGDSPRKALFTDPVPLDPDRHMVDSYMGLLAPLGLRAGKVEELDALFIPAEDRGPVDGWLAEKGVAAGDILVGMHPGSGARAPAKRWGVERYAEVIRRLRREYRAKVVLTGSAQEADLAAGIMKTAGPESVFTSSGLFDMRRTAALLSRCDLFISNDTGPMHVAAAVGTPTIGVFGPETPVRYAPVGRANTALYKKIHCSPCVHIYAGAVHDCEHGYCMQEITADDVWNAVLQYNLNGKER
jgi:heptosyltransferase-2